MPQLTITVGGREYRVACGAGEEAHLTKAANALNNEAERLAATGQVLPENTVLLMAGLMLADQVIAAPQGVDEAELAELESRAKSLGEELAGAKKDEEVLQARLKAAEAEAEAARKDAEAARAAASETAGDTEASEELSGKIAALTEERDAARAEAEGLRRDLDAAGTGGLNGDHEVLERMAIELERLADEIETGSLHAKAS